MTVRNAFFDSAGGDRVYGSADFAALLSAVVRNGRVIGYEDNMVVTATSPASMGVRVMEGAAFVNGRYIEVYDSPETLTIGAANPTNPRIDLVVARLDYTDREITLEVIAGTPGATPAPPSITQSGSVWEEILAEVYVSAGATSIAASQVTQPDPVLPDHRKSGARFIGLDIEMIRSGSGNSAEFDWGARFYANGLNTGEVSGSGGLWNVTGDVNADRYGVVRTGGAMFPREANPRFISRCRWVAGASGVNVIRYFGFHSASGDPGATFDTSTADAAILYSKANGNLIFKTSNNANVQTTTIESPDTSNFHTWEISTRNQGASWELRKDGVIVARHTTYVPRSAIALYGGCGLRNPSSGAAVDYSPTFDYVFADGDRA